MKYKDGILRGALDNFASMLAAGLVMVSMPDIHIEFTEDEEVTMDGARQVARANDNKDTMFIVMDVTDQAKGKDFTIENIHRIRIKEIRKALETFRGKYRIIPVGTESEAWLYKDMGFAVFEVDIPVKNGIHSLNCQTDLEKIKIAAKAVEALIRYFSTKLLAEIEEPV